MLQSLSECRRTIFFATPCENHLKMIGFMEAGFEEMADQ